MLHSIHSHIQTVMLLACLQANKQTWNRSSQFLTMMKIVKMTIHMAILTT